MRGLVKGKEGGKRGKKGREGVVRFQLFPSPLYLANSPLSGYPSRKRASTRALGWIGPSYMAGDLS